MEDSGSTLRIILDTGATIIPGDSVATKDGFVLLSAHTGESLSATLEQGDGHTSTSVELWSSSQATQSCNSLTFMANTVGAFGRPLTYAWTFGAATNQAMQTSLQSALTAASAGPILGISPGELSLAVSEAGGSTLNNPIVLEINIQVTNWLEGSNTTSTSVTILPDTEPVPNIAAQGSTALTFEVFEAVKASLIVLPVSYSACVGTDAPDNADVIIEWEYWQTSPPAWISLASANLVDDAKAPTVLELAAFTFDHNTVQELRATAKYESATQAAQNPSVTFTITIKPTPPVVAALKGPSQASPECAFTIDASDSVDPAENPAQPQGLSYAWSCSEPACDALVQGRSAAQLDFGAGNLTDGTYNFTVSVSRSGESSSSSASFTVAMVSGGPPPTTLSVPWTAGSRISVQKTYIKDLEATVQISAGCALAAGAVFQWALVDSAAPTIVSKLLPTKSASIASGHLYWTREFPGPSLTAGLSYAFALLYSSASLDLQSGDTIPASVLTFLTPAFKADGVPHSGMVQVNPVQGSALTSSFSFATSGWVDEDPSSALTYAFFRFPVTNGSLTLQGGSPTCGGPGTCHPSIDWQDPMSPQYWSKQGKKVGAWGTPDSVSGLIMPTGSYTVVARAQDTFGGKGVTMTLGPIVSAPDPEDLTPDALNSALDLAMSSNSPSNLMNSLSVVADMSSAAPLTADEKSAMAEKHIGCLETLGGITDASMDNVEQVGSVIGSVVQSGGDAMDSDQLGRVTDVLAGLISEADSLTPEAATGALGGFAATTASFSTGAGADSSANSSSLAAAAKKFANLASLVGAKLITEAPLGEMQQVNSVDSTGRGMALTVQRETPESAAAGMDMGELSIPPSSNTLLGGRRLTATCSQVTVQQTSYHKTNIYQWALSPSFTVPSDATLKTVEVRCSPAGQQSNLVDQVVIVLTSTSPLNGTDGLNPVCVVFNETTGSWSKEGVEWQSEANSTCISAHDIGTYTVAWEPNATTAPTTGFYPVAAPIFREDEGLASGTIALIVILCLLAVLGCLTGLVYIVMQRSKAEKNNKVGASPLRDAEAAMEDQLYLPLAVNNAIVLIPEGANIYRVDKSNVETQAPGLAFRLAKDMDQKHPDAFAAWDSRVEGVDEGDNWLKILTKEVLRAPSEAANVEQRLDVAQIREPDEQPPKDNEQPPEEPELQQVEVVEERLDVDQQVLREHPAEGLNDAERLRTATSCPCGWVPPASQALNRQDIDVTAQMDEEGGLSI
jgi:hypothetical protein